MEHVLPVLLLITVVTMAFSVYFVIKHSERKQAEGRAKFKRTMEMIEEMNERVDKW